MSKKHYAEVLVDVANRRLDQSYHYIIPDRFQVQPGMTVVVPLRNRKVQGLVVRLTDEPPAMDKEMVLKPIEAVLESERLIPAELVELAGWLAETTISPLAQSLHTVWPFLKGTAQQWIIPTVRMDDEDVKVLSILDPDTYHALTLLNRARRGGLPEDELIKKAKIKQALLDDMIKQGWVHKEMRFAKAGGSKRPGQTTPEPEKLSAKSPEKPSEKLAETECQPEPLRPDKKTVMDSHHSETGLSAAQAKVLSTIWQAYEQKSGRTVLLHGITGSGKTEVYRELAARVLAQGGDMIILVPEISLTSQLARVFTERFGEWVGIVHSGISSGEKLFMWEKALAGEKRIIIGARSAVFAPLRNLSVIILDEEHDNAYKQDENPKYHARDVARKRMEQRSGLVLIGSATPSLEAYAAAQRGVISLATLSERYNRQALPAVTIVDMKQELASGNKSMFSLLLTAKLKERIKNGEQSILFLNRRGYSTFVFCRECGYVARCPQCDVALTYHSSKQELWCHYCNFKQDVFHRCPECGSRYIRFFGQGTQKVEEEVAALFPDVEVLRLDTDTTSGQGKHQEILDQFRAGNVPILVGTQMLAKGLDFPNVTLVGVISADQLLNMPDFRSRERTFQLLTQVAGRAGRGLKPGEVIIQTHSPADRAILRAADQDYVRFFWEEIAYRKLQSYPPFAHIIRILIYHSKEEQVIRAAHDLATSIKKPLAAEDEQEYVILGPAPSVLTKLKNEYRWQISIKGKNPETLRRIVHSGVRDYYQNCTTSGVNLSIEVNPVST